MVENNRDRTVPITYSHSILPFARLDNKHALFVLFFYDDRLVREEVKVVAVERHDDERDVHNNERNHALHSERNHGARSEQGTHECGHSEQRSVHVRVEDAHDSEQGWGDIAESRSTVTKEEGIQREIPHKRLVLVLEWAPQQKREKGEEPQTRFASTLPAELILWEGEFVQEVQSNDVHGDRVGDQPDIIPVLDIAHGLERADDDHGQKAVQREDPVETQESAR